jgi:hypothetical protein
LPPSGSAHLTGYRPRAASGDLKEIVLVAMEELFATWDARFRHTHGPLHPRVRGLLEAFVRCGDLHFGFLRLRCANPDCTKKAERLLPFSCKSRHLCASCGQRRALQWAQRMVEEVLPFVPCRQLVFTIPIALRRGFLFDRSLYGDLCRVAYASTRDFLRLRATSFCARRHGVPAMVVSPQSHGDLLTHHPHIHAVSSLGLFRPDGIYLPMEDVDFTGLEELFRERFFRLMLRRGKVRPETVERMRAWEHSGFNVDFARKFDADDRGGLQGLLSYMERAPVSLRRLTFRADSMVHYQGTKVHPRLGTDHQLLTPVEFLAHLVHHVLLRFEVSSRSYGAISTTFRRRLGWIERPPVKHPPAKIVPIAGFLPGAPAPGPPSALPADPSTLPLDDALPLPAFPRPTGSDGTQDPDPLQARRRSWARLIARTWHEDPSLCNSCGKPMKTVAALSSPHQDHVIERILRHLSLWDPPWLRPPKARGPPPTAPGATVPNVRRSSTSSSIHPSHTIDPLIDDERYCADDIPPEDA